MGPGESETQTGEAPGLRGVLDRTCGLTAAGISVPTELRAGLATFLTMAYIMFVNPAILEKAGMDHGAVFVATYLAAALSTAIMGLYANYPIALAPGTGLNAYFAFTMVPKLGGNWQLALGMVFLSGALFLLISLTPLREWLINAIPLNLKLGIAAGIGLFLALIGLQNAGLVAAPDSTTLVKLGDRTEAKALLAIAGFLAIAGLAARKVPGAIIFGVIAVTLAALGTSTITAYIESAAGVEEGGRTGLTALVVAGLFLASLFLAPLAQTVPPYATAPALLFVALKLIFA
jgi:adenine/guanine/hypoxanthine permease